MSQVFKTWLSRTDSAYDACVACSAPLASILDGLANDT